MGEKIMQRRDFLKGFALGAAGLLGGETFARAAFGRNEKRPNVVLFVSDDHGTDALGCYGNPVIKTPGLDALAKDGTRFTHAFCTTASCSPSRSVILTGQHNHANGMYGLAHDYHKFESFDTVRSLPVMLTEAGYKTATAGKYHLAPKSVYKFDVTIPSGWKNPVDMAKKSRDFIEKTDDPFFLYFCVVDPHRSNPFKSHPYDKPNPFGNIPGGHPGVKEVEYNPDDVIVPPFLPDTPECRAELAQYYQSVSRVDQGVAELVKILKETGKYDNTLFVYISDNGIAFPGAKTTLYEPGMRLPCIIKTPKQKKQSATTDAMVSWTDITPTILDYARALPAKNDFHGRSFKSVLEKPTTPGFDEVYGSHGFHEVTMYYPMRVIRERRYKLIWNISYEQEYPFASDLWHCPTWQATVRKDKKMYGKRTVKAFLHRAEFELYDLQNDPDEINNLACDPRHKKTFDRLNKKMEKFQLETGDPWIIERTNEDIVGGITDKKV